MSKIKLTFASLCFAAFFAAPALADNYQYLWNKTTPEEETVTDWPSLPSNGVNYADIPYVLQYDGKNFFRFFGYEKDYCSAYAGEACSNEHAIVEISDCNARVSAVDRHLRVDLDSGTYNWLTPFGMTWKNKPAIDLMRTDHSSFDRTTFAVHGATTYWPTVRFAGTALVEDRFVLDGGTHTIGGEFIMPYRYADFYGSTASTYRFDVTNKASLTLNGAMQMGNNSPSGLYGDTKNKDIYFTVTDGSTLTLNAGVSQEIAGHHHVLIADSTVVNGDKFQFGPKDAASAKTMTTDTLITNSTYCSGVNIRAGSARFVNSVIGSSSTSSGFLSLGAFDGARTIVDLVKCSMQYGNNANWHRWPQKAGSCDLNVSGGTLSANFVYLGSDGSDNSTGTVTVTENAEVSVATLRLGARWGGLGTLNVHSGTTTITSLEIGARNNNGSVVGGVGVVNVSGGALKSAGMVMGNSAVVSHASYPSYPGTNLVHVTGGVFADTATGSGSVHSFVVCDNASARPSRVALDGGEMRVNKLYGGAGAQVNGGSSWAAFEADGGKLVPPFAASTLLYGFDEATLGERGLTVVSDSGCTIAQSFVDANGAKGRLILDGAGVKTLTGDQSGLSEVVVRGGTTDVTAAPLGGLTLDGGILNLSSAKPISVGGDLVVTAAKFALDAGFALNTTKTILSVVGAISESSKAALSEAVVDSGLAAGLAFDLGYDMESDPGKTLVTLTVREAKTVVVEATSGAVVDSEDHLVSAVDTLLAKAASGTTLTLKGELGRGNFEKTGAGVVTLANEANRFLGSLYLYEGKLSVSSMLALGYDAIGTGVFYLKGGTLELADAADPAIFPYNLNVSPDAANSAVVIKTDEDTVFRSVTPVRGAIIKRGRGELVFEAAESMNLVTGYGTMTADGVAPNRPDSGFVYDEQGTVPPTTESYGGLNVVEGELVLRGTGKAPAAVALTENVCVGLPTATRSKGAADPALVLDNVNVTMNNGGRPAIYVGGGASDDNTVFTSPRLVVSNGATVTMHNLMVNRNSANNSSQSAEVLVDGGTIVCKNRVFANACGRGSTASRFDIRNGGALLAGSSLDCHGVSSLGANCNNAITLVADGGLVAKSAAGEPTNFNAGNESSTLVFTNGARFCCNSFTRDSGEAGGSNKLYFDDSEWYPGAVDFTFANNVGNSSKYYASGRGLILAPPANITYTWAKKLEGTGGLVKRGAGTLVMPMTNLVATGTVAVEAGTLDLDGTTAEARTFSGSGAIRNGALESPVIKVAKDAAGLDLGTIAPTGRVRVDFSEYGDEVPLKTAIPVARVSGPVDLSMWRGKNFGVTGVKATFAVQDGVVLGTVDYAGLLLMVR